MRVFKRRTGRFAMILEEQDVAEPPIVFQIEHAVKQPFAFAIQATFNSQRGKFVWHHSKRPPRHVPAGAIAAVSQDLGRGLALIAGAERTKLSSFDLHAFAYKIHRPPRAIGGNDDPPPRDRILAKF